MLVSILIPVYNCKQWVSRAVESALAQTWQPKEIIVLDDASTDDTQQALRVYHRQIRIAQSPVNSGQNVSRNRLTEMSRGEWLVYLDADDELAPNSIAEKMAVGPNADAIYGTMDVTTFRDFEKVDSYSVDAQDYSDPLVAAFQWKFPNTSSFLFRAAALKQVGPWNENIKNCTDYDIIFRMLLQNMRFKAVPSAKSMYRQWSASQAVNEAPLRKMMSRLQLMSGAAERLNKKNQLWPERKLAFLNASLGVIRVIYPSDPELAKSEHQRLLSWDHQFVPSRKIFPFEYVRAYRLFGFATAERLAVLKRTLFQEKPDKQPF